MRVKIIRWTDPTSSQATLRVQRWCEGQWEPVRDFGLNESQQANEFAMKLSMSKRIPTEVAVFEDGEKLESAHGVDVFNLQHGTKLPDLGAEVPEKP